MHLFAGFPEAALDFYEGLEVDNTKAYWSDHKHVYDQCVAAPLKELAAALEPQFGELKVFRPYRDVRFSKDKTPYKTHAALHGHDSGQALYLQLGADGLMLAGGMYVATTDQARRLRAAIADDLAGRALLKAWKRLETEGFEVGGEHLKRVPKEHADAPRQDLLTLKTLVASQRHAPAGWLHEPEALEVIATAWKQLAPLNRWLGQHVGPPREPAKAVPAT